MNRAMEWQKGMEINYTNFPMPKGKKKKKPYSQSLFRLQTLSK